MEWCGECACACRGQSETLVYGSLQLGHPHTLLLLHLEVDVPCMFLLHLEVDVPCMFGVLSLTMLQTGAMLLQPQGLCDTVNRTFHDMGGCIVSFDCDNLC